MSSGLVVNRQFVKHVAPWSEPLRCTFFICVQKELVYTLSTDHKWTGNLIGWFGKACRTCGFEVRNLVGTIFLSVLFLTGGPPSVFLCEKILKFFLKKEQATRLVPIVGPHAKLRRLVSVMDVQKRVLHRIYTAKPSFCIALMYTTTCSTKLTIHAKF